MKKLTKLFSIILLSLLFTLSLIGCGLLLSGVIDDDNDDGDGDGTTTPTPKMSYEITYSNARLWKNSIGTIWVQTIFEVKNTGTSDLYLSSGSYDLEKLDGTLVASKTLVSVYPDVIAPNEKAYYYEETTVNAINEVIELKVVARPSVKIATVPKVRFPVSDLSLQDKLYGGLELMGRVTNDTTDTQSLVYIAVTLFDGSDNPIGHMFTIIMDDISAGQKTGFTVNSFSLPSDITAASVSRYEVISYTRQIQLF